MKYLTTPYKERLVYMIDAPYVRATNRKWEKKLAELVKPLADCLLTRDDFQELVTYLKARAEEIPGARPEQISTPDWKTYDKYGYTGGLRIGEITVHFRGVSKIPRSTVHNYLCDIDPDEYYKNID